MKRIFVAVLLIVLGFLLCAHAAVPEVILSSRVVDQSTRSLLAEVRESSGQMVDEVRLELPRNSAETAILSMGPKDWKLERDGRAIRLSGPAARAPFRIRVTLFDLGMLDRIKVKVRLQRKDVLDTQLT